MTEMLFDTDAMIREGQKMRGFGKELDPIARSFGQVPPGLPPQIAGQVKGECRRLEAGVRALTERVEGLGAFSVAIGERVKAADAEGGDAEQAERMLNIALLQLPQLQTGAVARIALEDLRKAWPDVFNAIDDVKGARAADDLMRSLDAGGLKNLDALAAFRRAHPGAPLPARLRAMDRTLRGAGRIAPWMQRAGIAGAMISQVLKDLARSDLELGDKLIRAAESGAIAYGAGRAASGGVRLLLERIGTKAVRGPWGWAAGLLGLGLSAVGAEKAGKVVSGEILFEPNPNDHTYMRIPPEQRSRIESEARGPYSYPDYTLHRFTPEEQARMDVLNDRAAKLDERINDQYSALHTKKPVEPIHYRRMADDLIRSMDERRGVAEAMDDVVD